jgi:tetratricopeptide (TPR) repeat protein
MTTNKQDLAYVEMMDRYERARDVNLIVSEENQKLRAQLKSLREAAERVRKACWFNVSGMHELDSALYEMGAALDAQVPSAAVSTTAELTIRFVQANQPWTVPYDASVQAAADSGSVPHILGAHCVLHAAKSLGKLAAVYESLDHNKAPHTALEVEHFGTVRAMAADLFTAALRFANLHQFDLATALAERVREKNGVSYPGLNTVVRQSTAIVRDAPVPSAQTPSALSDDLVRAAEIALEYNLGALRAAIDAQVYVPRHSGETPRRTGEDKMKDYKQAYETLREAAELVYDRLGYPDKINIEASIAELRAALDAQVPSAEPTLKERLQTNSETLISTPEWVRKSVSAERLFAGGEEANVRVLGRIVRTVSEDAEFAEGVATVLRAELESVRRERDDACRQLEERTRERDEAQKKLDALEDHCQTLDDSAYASIERLKCERDEAVAKNVKHIERGKWLTAEVYKLQDRWIAVRDECVKAKAELDAAVRQLTSGCDCAVVQQAPRAGQVFDPALVRELRTAVRPLLRPTVHADILGLWDALGLSENRAAEPTNRQVFDPALVRKVLKVLAQEHFGRSLDILNAAALVRDSENRGAEPYGIAETEALLAIVRTRFRGWIDLEKAAEAVRNSRSKQ